MNATYQLLSQKKINIADSQTPPFYIFAVSLSLRTRMEVINFSVISLYIVEPKSLLYTGQGQCDTLKAYICRGMFSPNSRRLWMKPKTPLDCVAIQGYPMTPRLSVDRPSEDKFAFFCFRVSWGPRREEKCPKPLTYRPRRSAAYSVHSRASRLRSSRLELQKSMLGRRSSKRKKLKER